MSRYFPFMALISAAIAVSGCTQEAEQAATSGDTPDETVAADPADETMPVEHKTLKPDASSADGDADGEKPETTEPETSSDDAPEPDNSEGDSSSEETP